MKNSPAVKTAIRNLRWWISGLLALATALSYLDRQSLPVVVTVLQKDIPLTDQQYGRLQFLFLLAYGVMYIAGGRLIDLLGTRRGYTLMIAWWSLASAAQGAVHSVAALGVCRFALGLGEGGGFPASAKAVSEWFPVRERSFAFGLFNSGSSVGAVLAPPLISLVVIWASWRWAFFLTGALGLVWCALWLWIYGLPEGHPRISPAEADYLHRNLAPAKVAGFRWTGLFRYSQLWGLIIPKLLSDSAWYFFIFWLPKYLGDVRHLNIREIGYYAWIPYAFAGLGSFAGGWFSSFLMRRNVALDRSRKIPMAIGASLMPGALLIAASPLSLAIVFFSAAFLGHQLFTTIIQTVVVDIFPQEAVGSVAGLVGAAGSFGAMLFNLLAGELVARTHSYDALFVMAGLLHPISFIILAIVIRRIGRIELEPAPSSLPQLQT